MLDLHLVKKFKNAEAHAEGAPVVVVGHLFHNLAVDLILQSFIPDGWTEDLVSQVHRPDSMFHGVVAHVLQDRWQPRLRTHMEVIKTRIWITHSTVLPFYTEKFFPQKTYTLHGQIKLISTSFDM